MTTCLPGLGIILLPDLLPSFFLGKALFLKAFPGLLIGKFVWGGNAVQVNIDHQVVPIRLPPLPQADAVG
jgi:hypothetical protein